MKYIKINDLKPGMVLALTLYDNHENILLKANRELNTFFINKIKSYNFDGLYVYEDNTISIQPTIISEETRIKTLKELKHINVDNCLYLANEILEEIKSNPSMIVEMINLSSYDNYTYMHSINVDILSVIIGIGLGFKDEELKQLSQAALLHDIGKTCLPIDILNKPGKLTPEEFEEIRKHPMYGYNLLKDNHNISSVVRNAVLSHHENEDGSGYPRNLKSDKIHTFAKIIHIADVYDALTAKRVYKDAYSPADALEYLMSKADTMFDPKIIEVFMKYVALYPIGTSVLLSNGKSATILRNHRTCLSRPIVMLSDGTTIDLLKNLDITITKHLTT